MKSEKIDSTTDRCTILINKVLFDDHSDEEWLDLYAQYNAIVTTATKEELNRLEESGIGKILYMICSGSNMSGILQSSKEAGVRLALLHS